MSKLNVRVDVFCQFRKSFFIPLTLPDILDNSEEDAVTD